MANSKSAFSEGRTEFGLYVLIIVLTLLSACQAVASGREAAKTLLSLSPTPSDMSFCAPSPEHGQSPLAPEDLVRLAEFGDPLAVRGPTNPTLAAFSPNRSMVAVVVRCGDPIRDANIGTLLIYKTSDFVADAPRPIHAIEFASATNSQPIALVRWSASSDLVTFVASQGDADPVVVGFDVNTGKARVLGDTGAPVQDYDFVAGQRFLATLSRSNPSERPECQRPGCRVLTNSYFSSWRAGDSSGPAKASVFDLQSGRILQAADPQGFDDDIYYCSPSLEGGVSPNGRYILRTCPVKKRPAWWSDYGGISSEVSYALRPTNVGAQLLMLTDMHTGASQRLYDAPYLVWPRTDAKPIWIRDGAEVIIPRGLESLVEVSGKERALRAGAWAALSFNPARNEVTTIAKLPSHVKNVRRAGWDEGEQVLTLTPTGDDGADLPLLRFRRSELGWTELIAPGSMPPAPRVPKIQFAVRQSLSEPPVLVAERPDGSKIELLKPNQWLENRRVGRVNAIRWQTPDGTTWEGGLYYPVDYVPGAKYPLVMLTHGFFPNIYSLTGISRNFAASAFAARGIMVLQVGEKIPRELYDRPEEFLSARRGYESAIDHLDSLGLIDRNRVGTVGWSRTGPWTGYLLTHSDYPIAASAMTAAGDFGWFQYILTGAWPGSEFLFGAPPWGEGLGAMLTYAPTFNLDRVQGPMLVWGGDGQMLGAFDWYSGLRANKRPAEMWYANDSTHDLNSVPQRKLLYALLTDWFDYWLNDRKDPDPAKAEQYARWAKLRVERDAVLQKPRRPLLEWSARPVEVKRKGR